MNNINSLRGDTGVSRSDGGWTASVCRAPRWTPERLSGSYLTIEAAKGAAWNALQADGKLAA